MGLLFLFIVGACVGSFLGALTWRWPREISIRDGRSRCPHCKHEIVWYDNIPIVSYLVLAGRCRNCKKKIPRRDFFIELGTAILFPIAYYLMPFVLVNLPWLSRFPTFVSLAIFLSTLSLSVAIFVIDLEHQYIPDTLVFITLTLILASFLLTDNNQLFIHLISGLGASLFLLLIHLATLGKGMGLGDVKLAVLMGTILGFPLSVAWMFIAFMVGAAVGLTLIFLKLARLKQKIAFGPFLIIAFFVTAVKGITILNYFYHFQI